MIDLRRSTGHERQSSVRDGSPGCTEVDALSRRSRAGVAEPAHRGAADPTYRRQRRSRQDRRPVLQQVRCGAVPRPKRQCRDQGPHSRARRRLPTSSGDHSWTCRGDWSTRMRLKHGQSDWGSRDVRASWRSYHGWSWDMTRDDRTRPKAPHYSSVAQAAARDWRKTGRCWPGCWYERCTSPSIYTASTQQVCFISGQLSRTRPAKLKAALVIMMSYFHAAISKKMVKTCACNNINLIKL